MNQCKATVVGNMKKIELQLQAGTERETMNLTEDPVSMDFVFGIGTSGITPFEYQLANRQPGESIVVRIQRNRAFEYFEHLTGTVLQTVPGNDDFFLKATISGVRPAETREIVSAMARSGNCGTGCDCGCGCGQHSPNVCSDCGNQCTPEDKFCTSCGCKLQ